MQAEEETDSILFPTQTVLRVGEVSKSILAPAFRDLWYQQEQLAQGIGNECLARSKFLHISIALKCQKSFLNAWDARDRHQKV